MDTLVEGKSVQFNLTVPEGLTTQQIIERIMALPAGTRLLILAPIIRGQKGEYRDLFTDLLKQGFVRARVDGNVVSLSDEGGRKEAKLALEQEPKVEGAFLALDVKTGAVRAMVGGRDFDSNQYNMATQAKAGAKAGSSGTAFAGAVALGVGVELAHSSIRFGLGRFNTDEEIDYTIKKVIEIVTKLREMSPLYEMAKEGVDLKSVQWAAH